MFYVHEHDLIRLSFSPSLCLWQCQVGLPVYESFELIVTFGFVIPNNIKYSKWQFISTRSVCACVCGGPVHVVGPWDTCCHLSVLSLDSGGLPVSPVPPPEREREREILRSLTSPPLKCYNSTLHFICERSENIVTHSRGIRGSLNDVAWMTDKIPSYFFL